MPNWVNTASGLTWFPKSPYALEAGGVAIFNIALTKLGEKSIKLARGTPTHG